MAKDPPWRRKILKAVCRARKLGLLVPQPCEVCQSEIVEAHHDDYNKPLEVRWLCRRHHNEWHDTNVPKYLPQIIQRYTRLRRYPRKEKGEATLAKSFWLVSPEGTPVHFPSIGCAGKWIGTDKSNVSKVLRSITKSIKGWHV